MLYKYKCYKNINALYETKLVTIGYRSVPYSSIALHEH